MMTPTSATDTATCTERRTAGERITFQRRSMASTVADRRDSGARIRDGGSMKSRVIQDDPDDGSPPPEAQREPRPAEPPPGPEGRARRRFVVRVLARFRRDP